MGNRFRFILLWGGVVRNKRSKIDSALVDAKLCIRSDPERANKLADWAFKESHVNQYFKGQADALLIFASLHIESSPLTGHDFALKATELYRKINDESCVAAALMIVARYYEKSGWTCRVHYVLLEAYNLATQSENNHIRAASLFNLGTNAEDRNDFAAALDYFSCAKLTAEESGDDPVYYRALCAEQEMHYGLRNGRFDLQKVHDASGSLSGRGMEETQIEIKLFLSKVSHDHQDFQTARMNLKQAYAIADAVQDEQAKTEIIYLLAENHLANGRCTVALKLIQIALNRSKSLGLRSVELTCFQLLAATMAQLGDPGRALEAMTAYSDIKDELHAHESQIHFQEMRTAYDMHLLEEESKALKRTNSDLAALNERLEAALLEKRTLQRELERLVTIDELTGALNRRESLSCGGEIISRFHSQGRPGVVMIIDIDHFKSINDGFGHSVGDEVLRRFTKSCQKVLRPTDRFGRLGGEEFCILLDRTSIEIALKVAERVMNSVRNCRVADLLGDRMVTASMGIAEVNRKHQSIEAALHDADLGLYEAKRTGRDKICVTGVKKRKAA